MVPYHNLNWAVNEKKSTIKIIVLGILILLHSAGFIYGVINDNTYLMYWTVGLIGIFIKLLGTAILFNRAIKAHKVNIAPQALIFVPAICGILYLIVMCVICGIAAEFGRDLTKQMILACGVWFIMVICG